MMTMTRQLFEETVDQKHVLSMTPRPSLLCGFFRWLTHVYFSFSFFVSLLPGVWGGWRLGAGPSKDAPGVKKTAKAKQGRGVFACFAMYVYAVLSKKILILATHPLKFCCLYFVFCFFFPLNFLTA